MNEEQASASTKIPAHQWTHDGDEVLNRQVRQRGYVEPQRLRSGPPKAKLQLRTGQPSPTCESGGFFGWPWGIGMGGGKEPDYSGRWIVFAAKPEAVILVENEKVKAGPTVRIVYCGTWYGALSRVRDGQRAWIAYFSDGASSATGDSSASSATGDRSIAAVTRGDSKVEAGNGGIAACSANRCMWVARKGSVFVQRYAEFDSQGEFVAWHTLILHGDDYEDGAVLMITDGKAEVKP